VKSLLTALPLASYAAVAVSCGAAVEVSQSGETEPGSGEGLTVLEIATHPAASSSASATLPVVVAPSKDAARVTANGVVIQDIREGTGRELTPPQNISVHYTGTLSDGSTFDSSVTRGKPFNFGIGKGQVIKGWEEGMLGMREGGIRRLIIPPELAYGERGAGGKIPPNATLTFEIELLAIE
jgi:FKBP-type peptidyl-prolyl cis-trans isomerase